MLERLAAWFLNTYVAEYVGNVVTDQLSIGLLKGAVELEKLPLKKDALKKLKLPVDIKSGYIGKLKLQIPSVRYIKSQPWVVRIDQLYIIAGPPQPSDYNVEEEERQSQSKKQAKLDKLEQQWKSEQQKAGGGWWFWSPFTVSFPSNVIANLQVIVNDVHIRYEDSDADPAHPIAVGIMLENISVQSTDENWEPKFVTGEEKARKLFDLQNFATYFDTEVLGELEGQELVNAMLLKKAAASSWQQPMTASTISSLGHPVEYIIQPVSGQAKLLRNCSKTPLRISDGPRFHLDIQFGEIPIVLCDHQYQAFVKLLEVFNLRFRAQMYQKWRPSVPVKESPRAWWKFATDCVLHKIQERNKRHSKSFALNRARQNVVYVMGYTQHLTQVSVELKEEVEAIEREQSFEELAVLRRVVMARVKRQQDLVEAARRRIELETAETNPGLIQRWFPGWISGYQAHTPEGEEGGREEGEEEGEGGVENRSDKTESTILEQSGNAAGNEVLSVEEGELLQELGYEADHDDVFLRDRIFLTLAFSLGGGSFQLATTPLPQDGSCLGPEPLVEFRFESLLAAADIRPRLRYASYDISLGSLTVRDHIDSKSLFPVLVQAKGAKVSAECNQLFQRQYTVEDPLDHQDNPALFSLRLVQEEVQQQKHFHVSVHSKPMDIVYNSFTVTQVREFLTAPLTNRNAVYHLKQELQTQTTAELRNRIGGILEAESKTNDHRISVKLDISAPHIILPENFHDQETAMVILDLGHVTFGNVSDWSAEEKDLGIEAQLPDIDEDDDDEFTTPPSSPPSEEDQPDGASLSQNMKPQDLQNALQAVSTCPRPRNDPFDRYILRLSDLQILIGKADDLWREAVKSGQSSLHLLDKFTLSVQIQRMLQCSPETLEQPSVTLLANLPSLRFHVDELKVHALISCLKPIHLPDSPHPSTPASPMEGSYFDSNLLDMTTSMYQSAFSPESLDEFHTTSGSLGESMYHSIVEENGLESVKLPQSLSNKTPVIARNVLSSDPELAQERQRRRLLAASEKMLSARLSIDEVLLSLSSRGRTVTELNVPGVKFEVLKRPYDTAVQLFVQDLCLVDRLQTFGPEYELVVCSSGRTIFTSPSPTTNESPEKLTPSPTCPDQSVTTPSSEPSHRVPSLEAVSTDIFDLSASVDSSSALLALTYTSISPLSPHHPATRDLGQEEMGVSEGEPHICKIRVQCTAVDALANQETIVELISFFQRALPEQFLSSGGSPTPAAWHTPQQMGVMAKQPLVQTEMKINFERLGVRLLRKVENRRRHLKPLQERDAGSSSRLVANLTFYGLSVEGRVSADVAINGRLEAIQVTDITPSGKKYPNIVSMGLQNGGILKPDNSMAEGVPRSGVGKEPQCLSFSIHRSPQSFSSATANQSYDIHLSGFVPSIHYTHSVNFVYETERFVSEFHLYLTNTLTSAAVGVAKGLVRDKSQLAEGLGKLSTSFGPALASKQSVNQSSVLSDRTELEETDVGLPFCSRDRLYFDISIQTPVIVLPSSLHSDECLVAHLGEISIKNEFVQQSEKLPPNEEEGTSLSSSAIYSEIDRMVLKISNMSLHAAGDKPSQEWLVTEYKNGGPSPSDKWSRVLKEATLMVQIDRRLGNQTCDISTESTEDRDTATESNDVVISGKICEPLLIWLSKDVFDQIRTTLKHGLHRRAAPRAMPKQETKMEGAGRHSSMSTGSLKRKVKFSSLVLPEESSDSLPKISASFSLPKLSLELKHMVGGQEKNLVYVSFDDFAVQCNVSELHLVSVDLTLKSIIIEDLLQPKDSEYRYLLASSSKPLPFLSPVITPPLTLHRLTKTKGLGASITRHLLPMAHLMSTPKAPISQSPLRSFSPYQDDVPKTERNLLGVEESGRTPQEAASSFSDMGDLLTINAQFVDEECPEFATKYNSVCGHASVNFGSVFVIINLQTWVLLFDYLGIGIPTPPPSQPNTPTSEDSFFSDSKESSVHFQFPPDPDSEEMSPAIDTGLKPATSSFSAMDESLLEDARDFCSLGSGENSIYMSTWQDLPERGPSQASEPDTGAMSDRSTLQEFSLGSARTEEEGDTESKSTVWGVEAKMSWDVGLNVRSLTVTFNKPEHPLARGNVSSLTARLELKKGNTQISGSLGQASVVDLTETGAYYRERFTTTGDQALTFDVFKYGRPDPLMERPFDISAKVRMASVRYLHTMRFLKEILAFLSHFPQLIDAFQRMKAMAQGNLVYHGPERKARILLDVDAVGPLLLIPKHAHSPEMMVGDIGHVRVTNSMLYDGQEGTITFLRKQKQGTMADSAEKSNEESNSSQTYPKLSPLASCVSTSQLSVITLDDSVCSQIPPMTRVTGPSPGWRTTSESSFMSTTPNMSSFTNLRQPGGNISGESDNSMFGSFQNSMYFSVEEDRRRVESQLAAFRGPCLLDCMVIDLTEVDVFSATREKLEGNNFKITRQPGKVLKEKAAAKIYFERNLYEDFCRDIPDIRIEGTLEAIHVMLDKPQLELVKGLIDLNLGEGIEEFEKPSTVIRDPIGQPVAADVWTVVLFRMEFVGVQLEFLQSRAAADIPGSLTRSLARFNIQQSEFSFESRSNQTRTVDFTSHAVIGYDTRYEDYDDKPSVFSEILRPKFKPTVEKKKSIQVEIHVVLSPNEIKASILLNKLRLMGIFDIILDLKSFVVDKISEEVEDVDEVDLPSMVTLADSLRQKLHSDNLLSSHQQEIKPEREITVKLSVTETDFVVVEDMTSINSNAVVLKGTLVLKLRSRPNKGKTVNCSIDGLELFSCALSNEDETALSILDPVSITVDVKPPSSHSRPTAASPSQTLTDNVYSQTLLIEVQQLNFRLSYNDVKLFLAIAQSLPNLNSLEKREQPFKPREGEVDEGVVKRLLPLGFTRASIRKELFLSDGDPDIAVTRLLKQQEENEDPLSAEGRGGGWEEVTEGELGQGEEESEDKEDKKLFTIGNVWVMVESLSMCLIDDCVDHDVPLLDLTLTAVQAQHDLLERKGKATTVLSGDYYNRNISAWEPVLEPWNVHASWERVKKYSTDLDSNAQPDRMKLIFSSPEQLCVNVTSSLIHILKITQASWRQDLQSGQSANTKKQILQKLPTHRRTGSGKLVPEEGSGESPRAVTNVEKGLALLHSVRFVSQTRQRSRFVPFLLRNSTGLPLRFATLTSVPSKVYVGPSALYEKTKGVSKAGGVVSERTSEWMEVEPGEEKPFDFSSKGKMRHRDTRSLLVHQLLVKVVGWERIDIPVSVDKVGVFFREVQPSCDLDHDNLPGLPKNRGTVRLVFTISLSDTQKVVNVRSALVLHNKMEIPLEIKLENPETDQEDLLPTINLPPLSTRGYAAVPLHLTSWNIRVRPQGWGVQFCSKHLAWKHVSGRAPTSHTRACKAFGEGEEPPFRFCVSVQRENFPPDPSPHLHPRPAHTLTLHPPLTVANLLPFDIQFYLSWSRIRKIVRKGKEIAVYSVDSQKPVEFLVAVEGFIGCEGCTVSVEKVGVVQGMGIDDSVGRRLRLTVTSEMLGGTALKISISCAYWLINRTGLPLVFKQEGASHEAAGQLEEHEKASTTTPLLFSYSEGDLVEKCTMRLGRGYRSLLGGQPSWCSPFRMISESGVRRVFVRNRDGRPDQEYQIGVDIRRGRQQYQNTRVVTFVARYQLENRTGYTLAYLQRHQLQDEQELSHAKKVPTIMPSAISAFHWPRTDLDQLLSIRVMDIPDCRWSGGFILDTDYSFHISMRVSFNRSTFIRCEVTLKGATFHIVFSDAAHYPPPFRLENLSQISLLYFQAGIAKASLITTLNPGQSVPYAWDEPTFHKKLCVQVKGSREVKEFDLNAFGPQGKLYYESYFYIAAVETFPRDSSSAVFYNSSSQRHRGYSELVVDIPQGTAAIFQQKDPERRSQLWRMTPSRQLVHIASSDYCGYSMVLDIAGDQLPGTDVGPLPLAIRKMSSSREKTQSWRFAEDGRLLLDNAGYLCIQSRRRGAEKFREGADVVIGRYVTRGEVPHEQRFSRMKHSPGSGVLSVKVVSDGPTRILRITDENKKYTHTAPRDDWVVVDHGLIAPSKSSDVDHQPESGNWENEEEGDTPTLEMELSLSLEHGVGVSLINSVPEELLFATFSGIRVEFVSSPVHQCLNATIQHIQVDNKLANSHTPILAYPTPPSSGEPECNYPVLRISAEKLPHKSPFAIVFKVLEVKVRELTLLLEEKLLFKVLQWAGVRSGPTHQGEGQDNEVMNMLTHRVVIPTSPEETAVQLYFEHLSISDTEFRVSMHTTSQLPEDLLRIKRQLGFPLVKFESPIFLDGFQHDHILGTTAVYLDAIMKHYKQAVQSQAIKILGSIDFLGNPVGLLTDVASGVSGMIAAQPDVMGLVRDVAHGMSDTTSKLTGTASHVLGQATFDSSFLEEREQILESCQTSGDHLKAGLISLSSGVFGGVTSIITQPYRGAQEYGVGGFFFGVGKGIIGTVAKPVAGLLDFASGTTAAIRETTSRISRHHPSPMRHRRCCVGPSGALTCYSVSQARGQEYLLRLTDGELSEKLVSYELLYEGVTPAERMKVIISSQCLYFFCESPPDPSTITARYSLDDLAECRAAQGKTSIPTIFIILSLIGKERDYKAPKFKCSDEKRARKVAQLINYAKNLHEEEKHIVRTLRLQQDAIW